MEYTNKQGIPIGIYNAIATDHYTDLDDKPSDYSITKIISPIQQTELLRRYEGTAKVPQRDILESYNAWIGSVLHNALEDASMNDKDVISERRFYKTIAGKIISGKVDAIKKKTIVDYKTCKVYKIMKMDTKQWEEQANCYRVLAEEEGIEIDKLQVEAMMLDWKPMEARIKKNQGYPQCPIQVIPLKVWDLSVTEQFIKQRVLYLENAKKVTDEELAEEFPCSREEQWSGYKDTAIYKINANRATKVFKSPEEAAEHMLDNDKLSIDTHYIVDRYSKRTRCEEYCSAKNICQQYKNENEGIEL